VIPAAAVAAAAAAVQVLLALGVAVKKVLAIVAAVQVEASAYSKAFEHHGSVGLWGFQQQRLVGWGVYPQPVLYRCVR
jgi:hypothetical protein